MCRGHCRKQVVEIKVEMDFEGGGSSRKVVAEMIGSPSHHTENPKTSEEPEPALQCAEKGNKPSNAEVKKRKQRRSKPRGSQMPQPSIISV